MIDLIDYKLGAVGGYKPQSLSTNELRVPAVADPEIMKGGSRAERAENNSVYLHTRHLSQMHIINDMRFYTEKATW